jgi:SWI/SNF-related matrix-associated actin-dependent regulator 1 of chromatin subfamily A
LVAKLKIDWTAKWIEEFFISHPKEKLMALTMHTFFIDHLKEKFGKEAVVIDGRVTGRMRQETVHQFQNNGRTRLLLGNWIAAGTGITLHASHNGVALDLPWTPGDLLQGEDRLHRIGQKKKVFIHYLMTLGTIEEKQIKVLRKKTRILDAVLDGKGKSKDLNIFDALIKEFQKE